MLLSPGLQTGLQADDHLLFLWCNSFQALFFDLIANGADVLKPIGMCELPLQGVFWLGLARLWKTSY